jgi:hypothetical protein
MAYQFVHIQTYCPKLTRVAGSVDHYNSVYQVFAEAERDPRYSEHVQEPAPPIPLMGFGAMSVADLRKLHDRRRAEIREAVTLTDGRSYQRGLKTDFPTLYTEIHSHPMTAEDYRNASVEEQGRVMAWAEIALEDFTRRMPEGVRFASVLHLDEGHVHFHILAVNLDDPKLSANKLHVGKIAAEACRLQKGRAETLEGLPRPELLDRPAKPKKPKPSKNRDTQKKRDASHAAALAEWQDECARIEAANARVLEDWQADNNSHLRAARKARKKKVADVEAYEAAMSGFQDRYFEAVGKRCGLLRNGPGAERLSTRQYAARKRSARQFAADEAESRAAAEQRARDLSKRELELQGRAEALDAREAMVRAGEAEVGRQKNVLVQRENTLTGAEHSIRAREKALKQAAAKLVEGQAALLRGEEALQANRRDFSREKVAFDHASHAKSRELQAREGAVAGQEAEVSAAVGAIGDLVGQMERGEVSLQDGKIRIGEIPPFLQRLMGTAPQRHTPVQKLVVRFVMLLKRAVTAFAGGPDLRNEESEDRPGW